MIASFLHVVAGLMVLWFFCQICDTRREEILVCEDVWVNRSYAA
jgi:hypothetical protein